MKRTLVVLLAVGVLWSAVPFAPSGSPTSGPSAATSPSLAQESGPAYPPGLSAAGVTDPLALVDAHRDALNDTSYALSSSVTYRRPNGSLLSSSVTTTRVAPGGASFYALSSQTNRAPAGPLGVGHTELAVWANETAAVRAVDTGNATPDYRRVARERAPFEPTGQWELLYSAFAATNTTVVERFEAEDGTTLFRVASTGVREASAYPTRARFGFVAVVDERGVVRTFQQSYRTTFRERPAVVSRTIQVTALGNVTVERPEWFEQAMANESVGR